MYTYEKDILIVPSSYDGMHVLGTKHSQWKGEKGYTLLPALIEARGNHKILISESALTDYPAMFLTAAATRNGISYTIHIKMARNGGCAAVLE